MNKIYPLLITFLLLAITAFGQTHFHRIDTSGNHWTQVLSNLSPNSPNNFSVTDLVYEYFTKGDTFYNGHIYKRIYYRPKYENDITQTTNQYGFNVTYYSSWNYSDTTTPVLSGGIREDTNGKVFFTRFDTVSSFTIKNCLKFKKDTTNTNYEKLLYDFKWHIGDTLYNVHCDSYDTATIASIDSVQLINGSYRRRWNLINNRGYTTENIMEGIGSNYGLFGLYTTSPSEEDIYLICFRDTTGYLYTIYPQDSLHNYFSCDSTNLATTQITPIVSTLKIYPNPMKDRCFLQYNLPTGEGTATLSIINVLGETVMHQNIQAYKHLQSIDMSLQPAGMYMAVIKTDGNVVKVSFIKQ